MDEFRAKFARVQRPHLHVSFDEINWTAGESRQPKAARRCRAGACGLVSKGELVIVLDDTGF